MASRLGDAGIAIWWPDGASIHAWWTACRGIRKSWGSRNHGTTIEIPDEDIAIPDLAAVVGEHDSAGAVPAKARRILELAGIDGVAEMLRLGVFIDNQISVHPVADSIVLHNDASDAPVT